MSDLKPCPFCGGTATHIKLNHVIGCIPCAIWVSEDRKDVWQHRIQPEATAPAPIPGLPFADLATPIKEFEARKAAALASSASALSAGDSEKALDALLTRIDDAFEAYERYGAICEFEGNPMIYADTLTEIVTLRGEYHAILQSQKGDHG